MLSLAKVVHNNLIPSLTNVCYSLMISSTSQSLGITRLLCATNPLTATPATIFHDYCLATYLTILIFLVTLKIITLAIFHAPFSPFKIITFHSPKTHNQIVCQSMFPTNLPGYILVSQLSFSKRHCL